MGSPILSILPFTPSEPVRGALEAMPPEQAWGLLIGLAAAVCLYLWAYRSFRDELEAEADWRRRLERVERELRRDPDNALAHRERGELYEMRGLAEKACDCYRRAGEGVEG